MKKNSVIEKLKTDPNYRVFVMITLLMAGFLLVFILNNVTSHFEPGTWSYHDARIFPTYPPSGNDFRVGYYRPAYYLVQSHFTSIGETGNYDSFYPPLVALLYVPFVLFKFSTAYAIHVVILIIANLACLLMAVLMVKRYLLSDLGLAETTVNIISLCLFFFTAIYIFSSYFFLYGIERGNTDILVMFLCVLTLWLLTKRPNNVWLQVIVLSVAVHLKIYPLVLFPLLLFKHGKKLILPAILVNVAFLFCLGPNMAWEFFKSLTAGGGGAGLGNAYSSAGNHSAYSFTVGIDKTDDKYLSGTFFVMWATTFLLPLVMWGITCISIVLRKYTTPNAVLFFMVTVPLMSLLPTVSIDYKLVIFGVAIILLFGLVIRQFLQKFSWLDLIQVLLLIGVLIMLSRSPAYISQDLPFIRNKYIWVLLLEVIMCVNILRNKKKRAQPETDPAGPVTAVLP